MNGDKPTFGSFLALVILLVLMLATWLALSLNGMSLSAQGLQLTSSAGMLAGALLGMQS